VVPGQLTQVVGIDGFDEWYSDILGAALAAKLQAGYLALKPTDLGPDADVMTGHAVRWRPNHSGARLFVNGEWRGRVWLRGRAA
jgi:hypothetical protein